MWTVTRHGGKNNDKWLNIFSGDEKDSREHFDKVSRQIRQGGIRLLDEKEKIIEELVKPRPRFAFAPKK